MADINLKAIDFKALKEQIKILNETGGLDPKIKIVGTTKESLVDQFDKALIKLDDAKVEIPESCITFYNSFISGSSTAAADPPATDPPATDPPATDPPDTDIPVDTKGKEKEKAPEKKKAPSKKVMSFEEIQARLKEPANPTAYMDKLMLEGGKIETLIAKLKEWLTSEEKDFSGFRTVSAVRTHIQYREQHGWIYEKGEDTVKLTGFKAKA